MRDASPSHALVIDLPHPGHRAVSGPLRVQLCEDKLLLTVSPAADLRERAEAREVVTAVCRYLERHQILHRVASQGPGDNCPETIIIPLPRHY